jgi:hypothetical protein
MKFGLKSCVYLRLIGDRESEDKSTGKPWKLFNKIAAKNLL